MDLDIWPGRGCGPDLCYAQKLHHLFASLPCENDRNSQIPSPLPKIGSLPVVFYFLKPNKHINSLGDELVLQFKYFWLRDPDLIRFAALIVILQLDSQNILCVCKKVLCYTCNLKTLFFYATESLSLIFY